MKFHFQFVYVKTKDLRHELAVVDAALSQSPSQSQ